MRKRDFISKNIGRFCRRLSYRDGLCRGLDPLHRPDTGNHIDICGVTGVGIAWDKTPCRLFSRSRRPVHSFDPSHKHLLFVYPQTPEIHAGVSIMSGLVLIFRHYPADKQPWMARRLLPKSRHQDVSKETTFQDIIAGYERALRIQRNRTEMATLLGENKLHKSRGDPSKKKFYCLEMFHIHPVKIHMGHVRNYAIGDVIARYKHMRGVNVLHRWAGMPSASQRKTRRSRIRCTPQNGPMRILSS